MYRRRWSQTKKLLLRPTNPLFTSLVFERCRTPSVPILSHFALSLSLFSKENARRPSLRPRQRTPMPEREDVVVGEEEEEEKEPRRRRRRKRSR